MGEFNAKIVTQDIIKWIQEYFVQQPSAKGTVLGVSGGKDSTVVAGLLVNALGKDKVIGILMPNGEQKDIDDSKFLCDYLGIQEVILNIQDIYKSFIDVWILSKQSRINIPPRIRMSLLYAMASTLHCRVAGTGNKSESYIGYTTKWGDNVCDFNPIADLTSDEVVLIGKELGLPNKLLNKTPSDGLCGKTDEDNFGFSYDVLNKYIKTGICKDRGIKSKIDSMHKYNQHKFNNIPYFKK
jgi:NAD+ synthase